MDCIISALETYVANKIIIIIFKDNFYKPCQNLNVKKKKNPNFKD